MQIARTLVTGLAGAAALTLAHEVVRRFEPRSPRLDKLGMQSLARVLRLAGVRPPRGRRLRGAALVSDLVANSLLFAPIGATRSGLLGTLLGAASGAGTVFFTPRLGFARRHRGFGARGEWLTIALYALGGLAAAELARMLRPSNEA